VVKLKKVVGSTTISFFKPREVMESVITVSEKVNPHSEAFMIIRDCFKEVKIGFSVITDNFTFPGWRSTTSSTLLRCSKGTAKESKGMLGCYFVILVILCVTAVTVGFLAVSRIGLVDDMVQTGWDQMNSQEKDWVFDKFGCCGYLAPDNVTCAEELKQNPNVQGCKSVLISTLAGKLQMVEVAGIVLTAVIFFGMIFTCCVYCAIPTEDELREKEREELRKAAFTINKYQAV